MLGDRAESAEALLVELLKLGELILQTQIDSSIVSFTAEVRRKKEGWVRKEIERCRVYCSFTDEIYILNLYID